jgi:hypothetical protein
MDNQQAANSICDYLVDSGRARWSGFGPAAQEAFKEELEAEFIRRGYEVIWHQDRSEIAWRRDPALVAAEADEVERAALDGHYAAWAHAARGNLDFFQRRATVVYSDYENQFVDGGQGIAEAVRPFSIRQGLTTNIHRRNNAIYIVISTADADEGAIDDAIAAWPLNRQG